MMPNPLDDVRASPKWDFRPDVSELLITIKRGEQLVRIFDADKANAGGYSGFDYNPKPVEDRPTQRGRYSARLSKRRSEVYSYLYVAEHKKDEVAALMECVHLLGFGRRAGSATRIVNFADVAHLAFAYTTTDRPLTVLDVSDRLSTDKLLADFDVLQGFDYRLTRAWGRYFRSLSPHIDGIYYRPVQYGGIDRGANILLFGPAQMNGDHLSPDRRITRFSDHGGRARLLAIQRAANASFQDMTA